MTKTLSSSEYSDVQTIARPSASEGDESGHMEFSRSLADLDPQVGDAREVAKQATKPPAAAPKVETAEDDIEDDEAVDTADISFDDLGLPDELLSQIAKVGFEKPSPIQQQTIPLILAGRDVIGQAQTGSGKTAAFVIPTLAGLERNGDIEALVLVPTRELGTQVMDEFNRFGRGIGVGTAGVVGGQSMSKQISAVNSKRTSVVVGTPGRMLDHLRSGTFKNFNPSIVILDEADEMLDMGFIEDIKAILSHTSEDRQTLLFSATLPRTILRLAKEQLKDPETISLVTKGDRHGDIDQRLYLVPGRQRELALLRLIDSEIPDKAIVFCRTKRDVIELTDQMLSHGLAVGCLHGDMSQNDRNRAIQNLKSGRITTMVATDVASRGLDIKDLSHVFNVHPADNQERYTHRIGRTGRAGTKGKAFSLVTPRELGENHYLLGINGGKMHSLPTRQSVSLRRNEKLSTEILAAPIDETAEAFLAGTDLPLEDLVLKLFSYVAKDFQVAGPDHLGFSEKEAERIAKESRPNSRGRRFGGGYRGGKPGGGYRGGKPGGGYRGGKSGGGYRGGKPGGWKRDGKPGGGKPGGWKQDGKPGGYRGGEGGGKPGGRFGKKKPSRFS